ncbi:MAG TPA: sigma-70 family RNA polymerase sigma factor [Solirubrobacterales bacterium]|nr:sigma-70 family RNA polymerase sigma factor [Solirubrobacterales bacterium]
MKNRGIEEAGLSPMKARQSDRALKLGALAEIERSLRAKLKAHNLSDPFIERSLEDALQKGLVEYLRLLDRGEVVENPAGFVVQAGFCRAIDELRREAWHADAAAIDALIDSAALPAQPTDEMAIDYLRAREMREAVSHLSPEEQQVLRLHYFDEKSAEASAKALFCSETTYRRKLDKAKEKLGELLGAAPQPGSPPAIEIGLVLWVSLRGANVALARGPMEQIIGIAHSVQDATAWAADRARDLAARFGGGGGGEKLTAIASSGPGRVVGTCVAVCVLAVGGAELAGVGQGGDHYRAQAHRAPHHKEAKKSPRPERVVVASPVPAPEPAAAQTWSKPRASQSQTSTSSASRTEQREQEATEAVRSQQLEGAVVEEAPAPEPAPETSTSSSSESSPTQIANEQFGP